MPNSGTPDPVITPRATADRPKRDASGEPPPLEVSPHVLTWWFSLMSVGGLATGLIGEQHGLARGILAHPLVIFFAVAAAVLVTMHVLYGGLLKVMSPVSLAAGCVIAIACYFIGGWFGVNLASMP